MTDRKTEKLFAHCSMKDDVAVDIDADEAILQRLKSMGPSAIELELSMLSSDPPDTAAAAADEDDDDLMINFIDFLAHLFCSKQDVDLATSYLGLLLKVGLRSFCCLSLT